MPRIPLRFGLVAWLLLPALTSEVRGQFTPRELIGDGLVVTASPLWNGYAGWVPVEVVVRPQRGPSAVDRTLTLEARSDHGGSTRRSAREVTLKAGAASARVVLSAPADSSWNPLTIDVRESGRPLTSNTNVLNWSGQRIRQNVPSILALDSSDQLPDRDLQNLTAAFPFSRQNGRIVDDHFRRTTADELPEEWIQYSALDLIVATPAGLRELRQKRPAAFEALRKWVVAGGNVLLFDLFGKPTPDEDLAQLFDAPDAPAGDGPRLRHTFAVQQVMAMRNQVANLRPTSYFAGDGVLTDGSSAQFIGARVKELTGYDCGLGRLVVSRSATVLDSQTLASSLLSTAFGLDRLFWRSRFGSTPEEGNTNFAELIPESIGRPPILAFQLLITLFVLAIGPLNYLILQKRNLVVLSVVTIPVVAGVATAAFLGFAVLSEGFTIRGRSRSFTWVSRGGETISTARLSFYAGSSPSREPSFSNDTLVHFFAQDPDYSRNDETAVSWDDRQRLGRGWLPIRRPVQWLTRQVRKTSMKLIVDEQNGVVRVRNGLGTPIKLLMLRDREGNLRTVSDIPVDGVKETGGNLPDAIADRTWQEMREKAQVPTEVDNSGTWNRSRYSYRPPQTASALQSTGGARPEKLLDALPEGARTFRAIVEGVPDLERGGVTVVDEDALHVIAGEY